MGEERIPKSHRKLSPENKILPLLLQGFEPATFLSRVRRPNHWAIPAPQTHSDVWRNGVWHGDWWHCGVCHNYWCVMWHEQWSVLLGLNCHPVTRGLLWFDLQGWLGEKQLLTLHCHDVTWKQPMKVHNLKPFSPFVFFRTGMWNNFHQSRCVVVPEKILLVGASMHVSARNFYRHWQRRVNWTINISQIQQPDCCFIIRSPPSLSGNGLTAQAKFQTVISYTAYVKRLRKKEESKGNWRKVTVAFFPTAVTVGGKKCCVHPLLHLAAVINNSCLIVVKLCHWNHRLYVFRW